MERRRKLTAAKTAVVVGAIPIVLWARSAGTDRGATGAPGEQTCSQTQCHLGTAPNAYGSVTVTFAAGATTYTPGVKQRLSVTIMDPNATMWGFQLTARQTANTGAMAGSFTSTDRFTAVLCMATPNDPTYLFRDFGENQNCPATKPLAYIEHTEAGSRRVKRESQTFEFDWTPPATNVGEIRIFAAANAADGNSNESGDRIYSISYHVPPAAATAPPAISPNGVVSAGAFGGFASAAAGSWVEIYGDHLSTTTREWSGVDFDGVNAPTSLDGVRVSVGGQAAFVRYVSPRQVNVQIPSNVPAGAQPTTVGNANGTSGAYTLTVNPLQPGLLAPSSFLIGGRQYAVALLSDGAYALPPNSIPGGASRPARAGETIVLYGVGFGPVMTGSNTNIPAGQIVQATNQLTNSLQVRIGSALANVSYFGLAPNFVGLYQFNVVVPAVPAGDAVPLTFTVGGTAGAQTLYTAVRD
jgi:uncharacterized protein (TIGR03437 family)